MKSSILALVLLGVFIHPVNAAAVEGSVILTMDSTKYCVGAPWNLNLSNAAPNAEIRLYGTVNNALWDIRHWADTDSSGNFKTSGTYATTTAGRYTLRAEIAGSESDTLPVEVVNCGWSASGSLATARSSHTATLLTNGKVLVVGGKGPNGYATTGTAELYDPTTGQWSATGSMSTPRWWPIAVRLANGKVLVAGGFSGIYGPTEISAEIYDPDTGTWRAAANLRDARAGHMATLLADGRVLVTGGSVSGYYGEGPSSAELYDPATDVWSPAGTMNSPRDLHTATLLPDGRVLVAGGINGVPLRSAELYDPTTGSWMATGELITPRVTHTATLLRNGKVLIAGGGREDYPYNHGDGIDKAELYDPATGQWSPTASLTAPRAALTMTLLPDGKVLAAGGFDGGRTVNSAELYDTATGRWSVSSSLKAARNFHTATLLANGKVLTAGGSSSIGSLNSTDLYDAGLETPRLALNATSYCIGDPWSLRVTHPSRAASVLLLGTSNGASWEIARWGDIDDTSGFNANGTFAAGTEGIHTLRVEVRGVRSTDVSFVVSKCKS